MTPDAPAVPTLNRVAWTLTFLVLLALGVVTWVALSHRPRADAPVIWNAGRFETVRALPATASVPQETWVVAVQPECPHCRQSLARVHEARDRHGARIRTVALLVDVSAAPDSAALAHVRAAAAVYRDTADVWRSWGGENWGDVFRFDRGGRLVGILVPLADSAATDSAAARVAAATR